VSGSSRIGTPYLVRSIEPNPIASHDWHVQPVCQRSLRVSRLSGSLWIEAPARAGIVLELGAPAGFYSASSAPPAFLREPFKNIELQPFCQAKLRFFIGLRAARTLKQHRRIALGNCPNPPWRIRGRSSLPGPAMAFVLCGIPDRGPELSRRTQRTCFPLPSFGQANWPPGGSTAHFDLSKSSIGYPLAQLAFPQSCRATIATC